MLNNKRILGLDPGLRFTGWGLLQVGPDGSYSCKECGLISVKSDLAMNERLKSLYLQLVDIIKSVGDVEVAVENVFVNKNGLSTMKLCMARGVILLVPTIFNLDVFEYTPNDIKKTITGNGHASKDDITKMINYILPSYKNLKIPKADTTDALATALCHAMYRNVMKAVGKSS